MAWPRIPGPCDLSTLTSQPVLMIRGAGNSLIKEQILGLSQTSHDLAASNDSSVSSSLQPRSGASLVSPGTVLRDVFLWTMALVVNAFVPKRSFQVRTVDLSLNHIIGSRIRQDVGICLSVCH